MSRAVWNFSDHYFNVHILTADVFTIPGSAASVIPGKKLSILQDITVVLKSRKHKKGEKMRSKAVLHSYPKYVITTDGFIGTFQHLAYQEFPVYRFPGGDRIADRK